MKKMTAVLAAIVLVFFALSATAEAMAKRTLREGKYIIGEDIKPGTYTLTCVGTAGEHLNDAYGALGGALDALDSGNGYSSLFGSLGGMMEEYVGLTVEIIGDYGDVLKSYTMKTGDSFQIRLEAGTALKITDGSCTIAIAEK